jgi:hypothetical protein
MANTSPFSLLTADGDYEINVIPGREHLLTLKDTFGGATVTMTALNPAYTSETFSAVDGGSWTATTEETFIPTGSKIRLAVSGAGGSTSIAVNLIPTRDK